jgi:hypothetical protein
MVPVTIGFVIVMILGMKHRTLQQKKELSLDVRDIVKKYKLEDKVNGKNWLTAIHCDFSSFRNGYIVKDNTNKEIAKVMLNPFQIEYQGSQYQRKINQDTLLNFQYSLVDSQSTVEVCKCIKNKKQYQLSENPDLIIQRKHISNLFASNSMTVFEIKEAIVGTYYSRTDMSPHIITFEKAANIPVHVQLFLVFDRQTQEHAGMTSR